MIPFRMSIGTWSSSVALRYYTIPFTSQVKVELKVEISRKFHFAVQFQENLALAMEIFFYFLVPSFFYSHLRVFRQTEEKWGFQRDTHP